MMESIPVASSVEFYSSMSGKNAWWALLTIFGLFWISGLRYIGNEDAPWFMPNSYEELTLATIGIIVIGLALRWAMGKPDRELLLQVDRKGLVYPQLSPQKLFWIEIKEFKLRRMSGTTSLLVYLKDPKRYVENLPFGKKLLSEGNTMFTRADIAIVITNSEVDHDEILRTCEEYKHAYLLAPSD